MTGRGRKVFVFDGAPPPLKLAEIDRRRAVKQRYDAEAAAALAKGTSPARTPGRR